MKARRIVSLSVLINLGLALLSLVAAGNGPATVSDLKSLLPRVDGWKFQDEPQLFSPGTLFEYIDGAAEAYLSYDFKELVVAQYQKDGTETTLTLEIYDMGLPLNAFGIFSSERYPDNPDVNIGNAGYLEEEVLNFISGSYYLKLICYNGGEQTADHLRQFAREVESRIKDKGSLPEVFRLFPAENRVKNSEKFIKKNFMGFDFLSQGYVVLYRQGQAEYEALIIDCGSPAEAASRLQKLVAFYAGEKNPFLKEDSRYHQKNAYGQHVLLARAGSCLYGFSRVPDDLLPSVLKQFEKMGQKLAAAK
ncbi:MAG: hypothetical protein HPY46_01285 [Candidatus Aminicenantes bacterium]|uniref:Uncharacterized protein n=1 Tax=Candidatus Saccharicenans subterraneus TaxID=2508984 RepID=A0A3E2BJC4_9BACT|nr:hypothetical protein [Candidatus Aminicenantes bacterium]RFT14835.1 MAG: hypothetical protein OP8BY_1528 [Candidatus Saccharicenans subterraneum]